MDPNQTLTGGKKALLMAVGTQNIPLVQMLLDKGADLHNSGGSFDSLLTVAVEKNDTKMVKFLLSLNVDVNQDVFMGKTALTTAVMSNNLEMVKLLINHGAKLQTGERGSSDAIRQAVLNGNVEMLNLFVAQGLDLKKVHQSTDLVEAVLKQKDTNMLRFLISNGIDINAKIGVRDAYMNQSAAKGAVQEMQILLQNGARLDVEDAFYGKSAHAAVRAKSPDALKFLFANGVDVEQRNSRAETPLHTACKSKRYLPAMQFLV